MAYLFDTDAISQVFKKTPVAAYVQWLKTVPPEAQFTCAPVIAELFAGAHASGTPAHFEQIRRRVIPELTVIPFALREAEVYGKIRAELQSQGQGLADLDMMIAACAMAHGLELVTGNRRHFERIVPLGLACCWVRCQVDAIHQTGNRPTMKKIITLVSLVVFAIIAALVYDLQVCIMLSKWFEFWSDVIILSVVIGLYTGTMFECMRELRWQRWLDSFDKEDEK